MKFLPLTLRNLMRRPVRTILTFCEWPSRWGSRSQASIA
jgi:hypothetical protein